MKAACVDTPELPAALTTTPALVVEPHAPRVTLPDGHHTLILGTVQLMVQRGRPMTLTAHAGNWNSAVREAERVCGLWFANFAPADWPKIGEKGYDTPKSQALRLFATEHLVIQPSHRVWSQTAKGTPTRYLVLLRDGIAVAKADSLDEDPVPLFTVEGGVWTPNPAHDYAFEGMMVTRVEELGPLPRMTGGTVRADLLGDDED